MITDLEWNRPWSPCTGPLEKWQLQDTVVWSRCNGRGRWSLCLINLRSCKCQWQNSKVKASFKNIHLAPGVEERRLSFKDVVSVNAAEGRSLWGERKYSVLPWVSHTYKSRKLLLKGDAIKKNILKNTFHLIKERKGLMTEEGKLLDMCVHGINS